MSGAKSTYLRENYPIQCFNGANHWELKWYEEAGFTHEVYPENPEKVYIGAFADRDKFSSAVGFREYAVVKSGDYYIQYNGAWGINVNTNEAANELTVTQQWDDGTYLVGKITNIPGSTWTLPDTDWTVKVCEKAEGSSSLAEVLAVWIGNGTPDCGGSGLANPSAESGVCRKHLQPCSVDGDCCSRNCRPTGTGLVCLPNPDAHLEKNLLRISEQSPTQRRRTGKLRKLQSH